MTLQYAFALLFADNWYDSPYIIPVAGCALAGCVTVAGIWSGVRTREMRSAERLAMIAQGLTPEPAWEQAPPHQATVEVNAPLRAPRAPRVPTDGAGAFRAGSMLCSIGIGLVVFFAFLAFVLRDRDVFSGAAAGIIPLFIGIGFFVDAAHRRREYDRWLASSPGMGPGRDAPLGSATSVATAPPPMTPAQASDWRPLH